MAVGMAWQDYDLELTRHADRCGRATFCPSGLEHSAVTAKGFAFEGQPWQVVRQAVWEVLTRPGA